jgi:hypothetical protein
MSEVELRRLRLFLRTAKWAMKDRLALIEPGVNAGDAEADMALVSAVEHTLSSPRVRGSTRVSYGLGDVGSVWVPADSERARRRFWDEDIDDDFGGGKSQVSGGDRMSWRIWVANLISELKEVRYEKNASHLARLVDVNSLKRPLLVADEVKVIRSILEYLAAFVDESLPKVASTAPLGIA